MAAPGGMDQTSTLRFFWLLLLARIRLRSMPLDWVRYVTVFWARWVDSPGDSLLSAPPDSSNILDGSCCILKAISSSIALARLSTVALLSLKGSSFNFVAAAGGGGGASTFTVVPAEALMSLSSIAVARTLIGPAPARDVSNMARLPVGVSLPLLELKRTVTGRLSALATSQAMVALSPARTVA